ncbi:MAG TPA: LuxR C-terminal-related transcriptional regulator, partial [Actinomycetota bacterium]|nr:LuxR C-terminal-related transcriptional regulator [Actinomycetota bacterium]
YLDATPEQRRRVHGRLAGVVADAPERARHRALAAEHPDAEVAAELDVVAGAVRSSAPSTAAELLELARALTPADLDEEAHGRALAAAAGHHEAGNTVKARQLLEHTLDAVAVGPARAEALARLSRIRADTDDLGAALELGEAALRDPDTSPGLRVEVSANLAAAALLHGDVGRASAVAAAAVDDAEELGLDELLAELLGVLARGDVLTGRDGWPSLVDLGVRLEEQGTGVDAGRSAGYARAQLQMWSGDLSGARQALRALRRYASDEGREQSLPLVLCTLVQVECQAGNWSDAAGHAEEAHRASLLSAGEPQRALALSARALVEAHLGKADACRASAHEGLEAAVRAGAGAAAREIRATLGFLELSLGNHAGARRQLRPVLDETARLGITEPGALRFVPDAVEATIAAGQPETAATLLAPFGERSRALGRPGGIGAATRGRALVAAARSDFTAALSALAESGDALEGAGMPLELARTLLAQGRVGRRARQWSPARESLGRALAIFDSLGARLWAEAARDELARVGGRAGSTGAELTVGERRVAELVGRGLKNREVADALFMSLKTVEATLTRVYRKLGVHSRAELRSAVGDAGSPQVP